jgi:hypothetical protein
MTFGTLSSGGRTEAHRSAAPLPPGRLSGGPGCSTESQRRTAGEQIREVGTELLRAADFTTIRSRKQRRGNRRSRHGGPFHGRDSAPACSRGFYRGRLPVGAQRPERDRSGAASRSGKRPLCAPRARRSSVSRQEWSAAELGSRWSFALGKRRLWLVGGCAWGRVRPASRCLSVPVRSDGSMQPNPEGIT